MDKFTRRQFLCSTAAASAVGVTITAPAVAEVPSTDSAAMDCWNAMVATLGDRVPEGGRIQFFGNATGARAEIAMISMEQVRPNVSIPVDHIIASYRLKPEGWVAEAP